MELYLLIKTLLTHKNQMENIIEIKVTPDGVFLLNKNGKLLKIS